MLIKLLKYDLKYMLKNMVIFYILSIFFAVLTRILFSLNSSVIVDVISQISVGCMFSMIASTLINTLMHSWVRFRDSIYKDESYLTHTLPVTKNDIYNSKFVQTLIFFIISFIVIVISLLIAYYTKDRWVLLTKFINDFTKSMNFNTNIFVLGILVVLFLEIFNALQCGYLGLLLGNRKENNRLRFSVLYGFISYLMSQGVAVFLIFISGLFNTNIMNLFKNNVGFSPNVIKLLMALSIIIYIIIIVVMNIICKKVFNNGVNVE